jgi:hypothetical protein
MDIDFPEPYDLEVPRRIGAARQELSPEGEEVLERILAQEGDPEEVVIAMKPLPQHETNILLALNRFLREAYHAAAQENQGHLDLLAQEGRIFRRAAELDPAFAARGGAVTLGEAVAVLRQHGEAPGISDEVLEMMVEVPRRDE